MKRKLSLILLYLGGSLLAIGGIGDQFISNLLDVHMTFLGDPLPSPLLERAEALIMLMLHVVGGGLMASGVACLFIIHFALRKGQRWAKGAIFVIAILSEGWNAFGMYSAGSYWMYPVSVLAILFGGLLLYEQDLVSQSV